MNWSSKDEFVCWKVGMFLTVPSKSHPSCCYFVSNHFVTLSSQDKGILNIEQENGVYSIHSLQGHDLNEARFTLLVWFSNIVNKSCVVRKASDYPGQSQGSFHQKYNNLTITLFLHCFSCYWLIFSLHFLSQSKQRVFSTLPRVELNRGYYTVARRYDIFFLFFATRK